MYPGEHDLLGLEKLQRQEGDFFVSWKNVDLVNAMLNPYLILESCKLTQVESLTSAGQLSICNVCLTRLSYTFTASAENLVKKLTSGHRF